MTTTSTSTTPASPAVTELRLVVEADDFDAALSFYRDTLGLPEQAAFNGAGDARVTILDCGRATLELANRAQQAMVDDIEVGRASTPRIRVAFQVADVEAVTASLVSAGAMLLGGPTDTPWRSRNARLDAPAGLQLTLFQELESPTERARQPGFATQPDR